MPCLETFCDADLIVAGDSNPPSCSSPVGNPGAVPFARAAQPAQASSWLEHNTPSAGASSPEPGVMNTPPSRPESSESNVQVWKLDAGAAENSETSNEPRQPLQSFTLQETLFVEQLAAIDERVRSQVRQRFCDRPNLTLTAFFRFQWTRRMSGHS